MPRSFARTEKSEGSLNRRGMSKARDLQEVTAATGIFWEEISIFTGHPAVL